MTVMMLVLKMITRVVVVAAISAASAEAKGRPNIIFVVADDLGWNDVQWHNSAMQTPNLNRFATEGVILDSSYVQQVCTPSRSAFMTGYFPYHTGLQHNVIKPNEPHFVPLNVTMLPALLQQAGYATHIVGKWHLGACDWKYTPTYRGFDSFFGFLTGTEDYYSHINRGYDLRDNKRVFEDPDETYFEYLLAEHALEVIEEHNVERPLFLYLPFHLVHSPLQVPEQYENRCSHIQCKDRRIYCGMVSMMDEIFGNITTALDIKGLLDNTLIIFTSDNGGPVYLSANNLPFRGCKGTLWEGGTRAAAFVWSRNLLSRKAYVNHGMMHAVDWFPTILHLAGVPEVSGTDGVNQWDMLSKGGASNRHEFVYNIDISDNRSAIRYNNYKLLTGSPGEYNDWYPVSESESCDHVQEDVRRDWNPQLYNIRDDPEERHDLAEKEPDTLAMMLGRLETWLASGVPPQGYHGEPKGSPVHGVWEPGWC